MALEARIEQLGQRHRELDLAIAEELNHPGFDQFRVAEMKRQKLRIKEQLEFLRSSNIPVS